MIVLDGSFGEGGGQILRTSIAFSALLGEPVKIVNIRAKRSNPGLRRQHMTAVKILAEITEAEVEGLHLGSKELTFKPKCKKSDNFTFDIGTAGSIPLVLQAILPVLMFSPSKSTVTITGGTDVAWSPPIDYIRLVMLKFLRLMGVNVKIEVFRRGHYPRGGGRVRVEVDPVSKLEPLEMTSQGRVLRIEGVSHCVKLPRHVAERQARSAINELKSKGFNVDFKVDIESYPPDRDPHFSPGSGIVLAAITENTVLGGDALGEKGKPAEIVGREAAIKLLEEVRSGAALDSHMSDMILPYLAVASGTSIFTGSKLTMHAYTNMYVIEKLSGVKFELLKGSIGKPFKVKVEGLSFSR